MSKSERGKEMTKKKDPSELIRKPVPEDQLKPSSRAIKRYRKKYPEKALAHSRVGEAKTSGKLKAQPCEKCGNPKAQAHHDDYSKPLDVRWLCSKCHSREHHGPVTEEQLARRKDVERRHQDKQNKKRKAARLIKAVGRDREKVQRQAYAEQLRLDGMSYEAIGEKLGVGKAQAFKIVNQPDYE